MLAFAILTASIMLIFIVPVFAGLFEDSAGRSSTRIVMGISDILTSFWGVLVYAAMGAAVFALSLEEDGERQEGVGTHLPQDTGQDRATVQKVALARFARTLGTLSAAGVPILQAIEITATSSGNWVVEKALLKSRDAIREGIPIHKPLEDEPVFPPMVTRMIAVGEETGDIDGMLGKIGDFYESEVDATIKALTSIIEPIMIVVVGGIVGFIVISMYLPMFKIYDLIGSERLPPAQISFCRIAGVGFYARRHHGWRSGVSSATGWWAHPPYSRPTSPTSPKRCAARRRAARSSSTSTRWTTTSSLT